MTAPETGQTADRVTNGGPTGGLEADLALERHGFELEARLSVPPGQTLVLLGPNGAGKSTIVEALAGLAPVDQGRIALAGRSLDEPSADRFVPPEDRNIGIVFQDYLLFDHLTVADNVAFSLRHRQGRRPDRNPSRRPARSPSLRPDRNPSRRRGQILGRRPGRSLGRRATRDRVASLLAALELTELADQRPGRLSGGQAQRVALARAMAGRPDLLLLDEPLAAVDVSTRTRLRRLLTDHLDRFPGPRLVITHDPNEAFALADRLAVIEAGRIVQQGEPEELRRHPATPWVAGLTGSNLIPGLASSAMVAVEGTDFVLTTTTELDGPVNAVIDPRAVALYRERPGGSPRNTWPSVVEWTEPLGLITRVRLGGPLPLNADITPSSAEALGLGPGAPIWAAVKATEIRVKPR